MTIDWLTCTLEDFDVCELSTVWRLSFVTLVGELSFAAVVTT